MSELRVLHIVSSVGSGGVERMLLNYYRELRDVQFDFIVHDHEFRMLEREFLALGAELYFVTPKKRSVVRNLMEVWRIVRAGDYDAVHCHQNQHNWFSLAIAWLCRVPVRISHAHGVAKVRRWQRWLIRWLATDFVSCSEVAGRSIYGEYPYIVLRNSISVEAFRFKEEARIALRRQFNLEGRFVLLQVGRFSAEKNQQFAVELLAALDERFVLVFVGAGPLEKIVRAEVEARKLSSRVTFLGERTDVAQVMAMADLLLLPSLAEGFGICAIEGQAAGLPVLASRAVPDEVKLTELVEFLPLEVEAWAQQILAYCERVQPAMMRGAANMALAKSPYENDVAVREYLDWLGRVAVR